MKIDACDLHMAEESKIVAAGWRLKVRGVGGQTISIHMCAAHRSAAKGRGYDAVVDIAFKAERNYAALVDGGAA